MLAKAPPQRGFKVRLMETITRGPAMRTEARRPCPVDDDRAVRIHKAHAGHGQQIRRHVVGDADGLKHPHALAIKLHGARQGVDVRFAVDDQHMQIAQRQQVRKRGAHRPHADNSHVILRSQHIVPRSRICHESDFNREVRHAIQTFSIPPNVVFLCAAENLAAPPRT